MTDEQPPVPAARSDRRRRQQVPQARRFGDVTLLLPPSAAGGNVSTIDHCLRELQDRWRQDGHLAALWRAWPRLAGPQLAPHCRPLRFQGGVLTVGAPPGPWLQALRYHRHQLMGAIRGAGFTLRDLRLEQDHPSPIPPPATRQDLEDWARHPCRVDVHGLADCPCCDRPAPAGEMARWGRCSFCHAGGG
jgi:predicted nucleic acid-binding Zn ribbon protein